MNNCETCKHWGVPGSWDDHPYETDGYRECRMAQTKLGKKPQTAERHPRSLMAAHGGDLGSYLFTAPNFGCIHWDGK